MKQVPRRDSLQSEQCADALKALSEPIRLRIIDVLRTGPRSVSEIAESVQQAIVTVSHHLGILRNAGLIQRKRKGRFIVYSLREGVLDAKQGSKVSDHINLGCCRLEIPKE